MNNPANRYPIYLVYYVSVINDPISKISHGGKEVHPFWLTTVGVSSPIFLKRDALRQTVIEPNKQLGK